MLSHRASTTNTIEPRPVIEPPPDVGRVQCIPSASKQRRTKPVAACNVMFSSPATGTSQQPRHHRSLSLHDFNRSQLTSVSTIKPSPPATVNANGLYNISVAATCVPSFTGPVPRLTTDALRQRTVLPNTPSFPGRQVGAGRRIVLPADCWLRFSHDTDPALHFMSPASRSMVARAGDFSDLQASMQIIGLGN